MKFKFWLIALVAALSLVACKSTNGSVEAEGSNTESAEADEPAGDEQAASESEAPKNPTAAMLAQYKENEDLAIATFAGGCFWCMEPPFEDKDGVKEVVSGYAGGEEQNPTYKQVAGGKTSHTETVQVVYDPSTITYAELLEIFWQQIDPTQADGQFVDIGSQYRTAIFYHDDEQKILAEQSKQMLAEEGPFDEEIVTEIQPLDKFWVAEEYHQDFYKKSTRRYKSYRSGSGRDPFIQKYWGDGEAEEVFSELGE
ncbi:MAG: peptide-methionine (S)-S-oxide reductase MsrA [Myxococcota bacterium]